ncbi:MAG: Rieske 2Fe-2S domain-containing protein [Nocardioidaceae bacterium]
MSTRDNPEAGGVPGNDQAVATTATGTAPDVVGDPIPDPGLHPHQPRPTDVDEAAAKRAERQIAAMFGASTIFALLFVVSYLVFDVGDDPTIVAGFGVSNIALGTCLGMALLLIGVGAIQWARKLMSDVEMVEMRHPASSSTEDREIAVAALNAGIEDSGIARRPLVRNSLLGAVAALGLPLIITLGDLGPLPGDKLARTVWRKGMRLVNDVAGTPIKPRDVEIGQLINGEPAIFYENDEEGEPLYEGVELNQAKTKAAIIIVRMKPEEITPPKGRENWGVAGILCYSKICTHVGCPISLWEQQTHHLLCPCHQSTFDLADGGKVIFGPAARAVPQLPIMVDDAGYLVAQSDFTEPVGPSYWERG